MIQNISCLPRATVCVGGFVSMYGACGVGRWCVSGYGG